jgi:SPP1 gp7 family putative phage head morphogenesis protein
VKKPSKAAINQLHRRRARARNALAAAYASLLRPLVDALREQTRKTVAALPWPDEPDDDDETFEDDTVFVDTTKRTNYAMIAAGFLAAGAIMAAMFGKRAQPIAKRVVLAAQKTGAQWVDEDAQALAGIDAREFFKGKTKVPFQAAIKDNVALIKSIPVQHLERVQALVTAAFEGGKRAEAIAADIEAIGDVTDRRAAFIARDQMAKITSTANEQRLRDLGVERYIWSTSQDERVRKQHVELEGLEFRFDDPPDSGTDGEALNPGHPVACRCSAIPLFDDIT